MDYSQNSIFSDLEAEAAFLGSLILDFSVFPESSEYIPDDTYFTLPEHRHIFNSIVDIAKSETKIDLVVVRNKLIDQERLKATGGTEYLVRVAESVPTSANWKMYANILIEKHQRRRVYEVAETAMKSIQDFNNSSENVASRAETDMSSALDNVNKKSYSLMEDVFKDMSEENRVQRFTTTGFRNHDDFYIGFGNGHLIIVAGRPSMGKTSMLLNMAYNIVSIGKTSVAYFSLEMGKQEIAKRILSQVTKTSSYDIYKNWLPQDKTDAADSMKNILAKHKFIIDETRGLNTDLLRSKIKYYQKKYGIKVAFVDYLQLLSTKDKTKDLYTKACLLSNELKSMALSLDIPIVIGSQLNRGVEGRPDHRPKMSDLRDSGKLEEDADVILMLYRPSYYVNKSDKSAMAEYTETETIEVIVEKDRPCGKTGIIEMEFYKNCGLFEDRL